MVLRPILGALRRAKYTSTFRQLSLSLVLKRKHISPQTHHTQYDKSELGQTPLSAFLMGFLQFKLIKIFTTKLSNWINL